MADDIEAADALRAQLERVLQDGAIITHTRCMGRVEEHHFAGWDGYWMVGDTTCDSISLGVSACGANDIGVRNITHINRRPIADVLAAGEKVAGVSYPGLTDFLPVRVSDGDGVVALNRIAALRPQQATENGAGGTKLHLVGGGTLFVLERYADVMRKLVAYQQTRFPDDVPF